MPPPKLTLGTVLRELQLGSGISNELLSATLKVPTHELADWYVDREIPSRDMLLLIAVLLSNGAPVASELLLEAGFGQLTRADEARLSEIVADASYEQVIRARRTFQALNSMSYDIYRATDQATLASQLETQLKEIETLLLAYREEPGTREPTPDVFTALSGLVEQARHTAQRITADVILPSREDMQVRLVTASSFERLEEYHSEENKWLSVAGVLIGTLLGIVVNAITGGVMTVAAWLFFGLSLGLGILTIFTATTYRKRAEALKNRMVAGSPTPSIPMNRQVD